MNARTLHLIKDEVGRLQAQLAVCHMQGFKVRAVTSVARHLLLQGPYFYNGRHCDPKAKSLIAAPSHQKENLMEENRLHIFTVSGCTFTFRSIIVQADNEAVLSFDYTSQSDGKKKRAVFLKANMSGWSTTI